MIYICPGIGLLALIIALLLWWLRKNRCQHDLSLRNVAAATNAHEVRVSAYTPGAQILNASAPSNWTQTSNYPASIVWRPVGGGPIPSGNPLPGPFSIWVQNSSQPDKRVLIEWLSIGGKEVICKQILRVSCGENPKLVPDDEPLEDAGTSASCRCLSVETDSDEDSNEYADPDLSVDVGTPVQTGYLQVDVSYTIEAEPPTLQFTRQWDVTVMDELGEEQPVTVPISDNLTGIATFTLRDAGDYNFYLTVTDPATCVSAKDRDDDEYTDTDFTTFKMESGSTDFLVEAIDPCDPRRYKFTNDSNPGLKPEWTVYDLSLPAGQQLIYTDTNGNDVLYYNFPNVNASYKICLTTYDSNNFSSMWCKTVTTTPKANNPDFTTEPINSCGFDNFVVRFINTSKGDPCPILGWEWDFGDTTPHSTVFEPQHTYAVANTYTVTLKMTILVAGTPTVFSTSKSVVVGHWTPDINATVCTDGTVIYETHAPAGSHPLRRERTWSFPDSDAHWHPLLHRHKQKVRVCYDTPGLKIAKLYAVNHFDQACETIQEVFIPTIDRCCPHDKIKGNLNDQEFSYNNKQYRLHTVLRYYGSPHSVIFMKSKLQWLNKKGKWRRKPADTISVELDGDVFTKAGNGCFCANGHHVHDHKARAGRARISKRHLPPLIAPIRVKRDGLTSTHFVKVDGNDPGRSFTLSLWAHDCGCQ